ncbi:unnamed protein product [Tetraodon nigroviridis]|uniref:Thrombomodulin n=1 Tax=Tetraodon nigroviridis TaxID=99883 RepID=Q4SWS1_TETNG|nr:unnamed protein product [Tetraodon nigroviridis]
MVFSAKQLRVFALFLCGLQEAALSHGGLCTDTQCFGVFVKPTRYSDARRVCEDFSGRMFRYNLTVLTDIFKSLPDGEFWLEQEEAAATPQNCSSVALTPERSFAHRRAPCHQTLSGFLCQYPLQDSCSQLEPAGASRVNYTAHMDFAVWNSQIFPMGTTAEAFAAGSQHLEWKRLCISGFWLEAPWNCEVMKGGCEHGCNVTTASCTCPAGQSLHGNNLSCVEDPCARCAQECRREGDARVCGCKEGYRLGRDGRSCVDVDECEDGDPCTGEGEECVNVEGSFECHCEDGLEREEGACVNRSICFKCEHMKCVKSSGVYECACQEGYRVRANDPTKCDRHCEESRCEPQCDPNSQGQMQCFCPEGYILDQSNSSGVCIQIDECEHACEHTCVKTPGGFRCSCFEGFILHRDSRCLPVGRERARHRRVPGAVRRAAPLPHLQLGEAVPQVRPRDPQAPKHRHLPPAAGHHRDLQEVVLLMSLFPTPTDTPGQPSGFKTMKYLSQKLGAVMVNV